MVGRFLDDHHLTGVGADDLFPGAGDRYRVITTTALGTNKAHAKEDRKKERQKAAGKMTGQEAGYV